MRAETGDGVSVEAVETFMEKVLGDYAGANAFFMAAIGDRPGLFKDLAANGNVVTTFDVVHDSADPRGLLRAIHDSLKPDGRYICVDINCSECPEDNAGPLGTVMYGLSLPGCRSRTRSTTSTCSRPSTTALDH